MKKSNFCIRCIILLTSLFVLSACTKELLYNITQPNASANQERQCSELPRSQRAECNERAMSYEEYEKARSETLDN